MKNVLTPQQIESYLRDVEKHCDENFNVHLELVYFVSDNTVTIHRIRARNKGYGNGSAALKYVCDFADKHMISLDLIPTADFVQDDQHLINWYRRHGFVYNNHQMHREPKNNETMRTTANTYGAVSLT